MRKWISPHPPEICASRLQNALWEQFDWSLREPVRGIVWGRCFRLKVREFKRYMGDDNRVSCCLYGRIRREVNGSEIQIWEFSGLFDPLWMAFSLVFALFFFLQITDGSWLVVVIFLLFQATGFLLSMANYDERVEKDHALVVDLRHFARTALDAQEVREPEK